MRKLYAATVMMQKIEGNRVDTKPVLSLLWGTDIGEVKKDAAFSASVTLPDMKVIETQAVQIPDAIILEAAANLS
jgi:hypothetical protein